MGPTKLKEHSSLSKLTTVLSISREKITADSALKIVPERIEENLATTRGIYFEKGEKLRDEAPTTSASGYASHTIAEPLFCEHAVAKGGAH